MNDKEILMCLCSYCYLQSMRFKLVDSYCKQCNDMLRRYNKNENT